jgi:phosphoribosylformimino-5-aminoimidazole carboxamide ribotide isomerase
MIEIIPAIDVIEGKCVRLTQGDFAEKKIYNDNPLEVAKEFEAVGLRRLHIVDLDGAKNGKVTNLPVLEKIAANTDLQIDFGGGVKNLEDVQRIFDTGAKFVSVGSVAVKEPDKFQSWLNKFGGEKILLGADVKNRKIAINGWQTATEIDLFEFLQHWQVSGVKQVFCTDISKDGLLQGAATKLYQEIKQNLPELHLIASGGVSKIEDFSELEAAGCQGVIVGKAIYEGRISLEEIRSYLKNVSVPPAVAGG